MPNPFHFRANIDRLWRQANSSAPGYRRLNALDAITRELFAPNDRSRLNYQTYLATDPFDVARHKLRDLHDRPDSTSPAGVGTLRPPLPLREACPALDAGGWGEGSLASGPEDELTKEDDDPW